MGNGVRCLFIRGAQPRGWKTITICRFFESKNFGVCNAFSTPGLNVSVGEFFYFYLLSYCIAFNVAYSLSFSSYFHILEELLPSYPEALLPLFSFSLSIQFRFWPCLLSEVSSFSLLAPIKTLGGFMTSYDLLRFFHAITDDSGAHLCTWLRYIKLALLFNYYAVP